MKNSDGLYSVSYNQYTDIPQRANSKIIFNEEATKRLQIMLAYSVTFNKEYGCFFHRNRV